MANGQMTHEHAFDPSKTVRATVQHDSTSPLGPNESKKTWAWSPLLDSQWLVERI